MSLDQDLDLFFGHSSDAATQVYARLARPTAGRTSLAGTITGPFCNAVRTLPSSVVFQDLGPGPTLLARAIVPDLCPWLPEEPHLYRVQIELVENGKVIETTQRQWGAHRFGTRGRDLLWDKQRVVLRGVHGSPAPQNLEDCMIESAPAIFVNDPTEDLLKEASRRGVPLVAAVSDAKMQWIESLKQLARWPAVLIAAIQGSLPEGFLPKETTPNLILAVVLDHSSNLPDWARVAFCDENVIERIQDLNAMKIPIVATRVSGGGLDIRCARAECDTLQRDLARIGQFAGYFIL